MYCRRSSLCRARAADRVHSRARNLILACNDCGKHVFASNLSFGAHFLSNNLYSRSVNNSQIGARKCQTCKCSSKESCRCRQLGRQLTVLTYSLQEKVEVICRSRPEHVTTLCCKYQKRSALILARFSVSKNCSTTAGCSGSVCWAVYQRTQFVIQSGAELDATLLVVHAETISGACLLGPAYRGHA